MSCPEGTPIEPNAWPTEEDLLRWVEHTVVLFGGRRSTGLRCAAEFAAAFERGEIRMPQVAPVPRSKP